MKILVYVSFILASLSSFAQPENAEIEVIDGKRYYIHMVQGGNTLYGIHKLYNVPVETIIAANPETAKGLTEGQRLVIPIAGVESLPENLVIHTVKPKETLYGISKSYETTVEKLVELNPGIELGLKEGQEIKVPYKLPVGKGEPLKEQQQEYKVSFTDSTINHTVMKGETIYSISKRFMVPVPELKKVNDLKSDKLKPGEIIKIPIKKEKIEKVEIRKVDPPKKIEPTKPNDKPIVRDTPKPKDSVFLFQKKESYNIAVLIPLFLDKGEGYSSSVSNLAAEYYMGTKFALDSLKALGLNAKVYIHDSNNDTNSLITILAKPEFQSMDLVIGPFFGTNASYVANWCKNHGVRMICPVSTSYEILRNNTYVYESVSSDVTLAEGLAKYVKKVSSGEKIILVKPKSKEDIIIHEAFRVAFKKANEGNDSLPKIIETNTTDFTTFILANENAHVIFLSTDKTEVAELLSALNKATEKMVLGKLVPGKISVYGTKDWDTFNNIENVLFAKFNVHFASPYNLNYKNDRTKNFDKHYRAAYKTRVSKMALQGYDVTMYFCQALLMGKDPKNGIMNNFKMEQKGSSNGYENVSCFIMKHMEYSFVKVMDINE